MNVRNKVRNRLWDEVCTALRNQVTVKQAKEKWKNLSDTYNRCKGKGKKDLKKTGSAATKKIKWRFYDQMSFLDNGNLENQVTESNINETVDSDDSTSTSGDKSGEYEQEDDAGPSHGRKRKHTADAAALNKIAEALSKPPPPIVFPPPPRSPVVCEPDELKSFSLLVENRFRQLNENEQKERMRKIFQLLH